MDGTQNEVFIMLITSTALILLLGAIVVMILLIQKKRKFQFERQLSTLKSHYEKTMLETKLKILEETFRAISQNLHDNIGSNISTAMLLLYRDANVEEHEYEVNRQEAIKILDHVVDELKNIAHSLNPDYLDEIGLNEAVRLRVAQLSKTKKYKIALKQNKPPQKLNRQKQVILFYIFQEAINNISTHASASEIGVKMNYTNNHLEFDITDNGKGMNIHAQTSSNNLRGNGLINMKNHADMIAANLDIKSEPGSGTSITLMIPDPYH